MDRDVEGDDRVWLTCQSDMHVGLHNNGHPKLEPVELYRKVEERRYLDLAAHLIGQRGRGLLGNVYPEVYPGPSRRGSDGPRSCSGAGPPK